MEGLMTIVGTFLLILLIGALIIIPIDLYNAVNNVETIEEETFEVVITGLYVDDNQYKVAVSGDDVNKVISTTEGMFATLSIGDTVVVKKTTIKNTHYDDQVEWAIAGRN